MARPTGTITFLFSDIEGSTQHWEKQRATMPDALRKHDELIRSAVEAQGGYVFKTVGDEFCAAFWRASDATAAALDAQRALAREDWSAIGGLAVRMALHSGATHERDGDYFGPVVNRVARLLAVANGGQVLISGSTALLLREIMPERTELRDLGEHRLKDLIEPEHVWQLIAPDLCETFPPLRSLRSLPNNLPRQLTPLVGREDVLAEIEPFVREHPLVTLVGTGGVGKTRVALQVGANLLDGSGDGVWFVELAPLTDSELVAGTIAAALGVREQQQRSILETLLHYLKPLRLLLVLDNCEHVIQEAAKVAAAILQGAPDVRILATSREPLRITGEHAFRMPSLAVPIEGDMVSADEALKYGAVALFTLRASEADSKFRLTDDSVPVVIEICQRLDGIAFAVELAAARVKVLGPRRLASRLDERFRVLTGGSRTALPRQQTMRALIDWSHDLLSEQEQKLFRRVAIFVGGWMLEAAEAVCADETLELLDVVDLMGSLVEKSLVVADADEGEARYRFLESTRAFALEKLAGSGERLEILRRHAQWVAGVAEKAKGALWTMPTERFLADFDSEVENARSAIEWTLSDGDDPSMAARIAAGFTDVWRLTRGEAEPRRWLEAVIPRLDPATELTVAASAWRALSRVTFGVTSVEAAQRAAELSELCGDDLGRLRSLTMLTYALCQVGRVEEGREKIESALQLAQEAGLKHSAHYATALDAWGTTAQALGRLEEARKAFSDTLSVAATSNNEYQAGVTRLNMAELAFVTGDARQALELVEAAIARMVGPHDRRTIVGLVNRAAYSLALGDVDAARNSATEALRLSRGTSPMDATVAIQHLATVAARLGDPHRSARLCGYVDACYRKDGLERELTEQRTYEILRSALRERLNDGEIEALAFEGAQMSEDQAVAEALAV